MITAKRINYMLNPFDSNNTTMAVAGSINKFDSKNNFYFKYVEGNQLVTMKGITGFDCFNDDLELHMFLCFIWLSEFGDTK